MTRAETLDTTFMTTTNTAPYQVTSTRIPKAYLSYDKIDPTISTSTNIVNIASLRAIDTNRPDWGDQTTADKARAVDPLSHNSETTGDDASSKVRTIFFEVVGACIGVATLFVAVLALRRMPMPKQPDPESLPLGQNNHLPSQQAEVAQVQSQGAPVELDAVRPTVEMQCEGPAIQNPNEQATE